MSAVMLASLLLLSSVFFAFGNRINSQIEKSTHQRIEEYAEQQKAYISAVLSFRHSLLSAVSACYGDTLLHSEADFQKQADTLMLAGDFDHILTIDLDGNYRLNTGETGQGSDPVGRQMMLDDEQSISPPFRAFFHDDALCVLFSVPLRNQSGERTGMLSASYTAQRFARMLLHEYNRASAFSLLTDEEGNLLFSSSEDNLFIPDSDSPAEQRLVPSPTFFSDADSAVIRASMARREDNLYTVNHNGIDYVVVQTPLEQNNWLLFSMVPTAILAEDFAYITRLHHMQLIFISLILAALAAALLLLMLRDWRRLHRENSSLALRARTDSMTGLLNQGTTSESITAELHAHMGEGMLLLLDIDNLKQINDTMGHPVGDRTILVLSDLMREVFSDASVIGRIGGDEFMIFLSKPRSREDVREQIQTLQDKLKQTMKSELLSEITPYFSIGAAYAKPGDDYTSLYRRADVALYHVKRHGKDGHCFFEDIT